MSSTSSPVGGKDGSVLSSRLEEVLGGQVAWLSVFCQKFVLARDYFVYSEPLGMLECIAPAWEGG